MSPHEHSAERPCLSRRAFLLSGGTAVTVTLLHRPLNRAFRHGAAVQRARYPPRPGASPGAPPRPGPGGPGGASHMAQGVTPYYLPEDRIPLPPADAKVTTTACDYCIVGCGYKVYTWPLGREGGPRPGQDAPTAALPAQ